MLTEKARLFIEDRQSYAVVGEPFGREYLRTPSALATRFLCCTILRVPVNTSSSVSSSTYTVATPTSAFGPAPSLANAAEESAGAEEPDGSGMNQASARRVLEAPGGGLRADERCIWVGSPEELVEDGKRVNLKRRETPNGT